MLLNTFEARGLEAMKDTFGDLLADNPDELHFRESYMNRAGYNLMGKGEVEAAVYLFEQNIMLFPESYNTHDSHGDGLMAMGDTAAAIAAYQRVLAIKPDLSYTTDKLKKLLGE